MTSEVFCPVVSWMTFQVRSMVERSLALPADLGGRGRAGLETGIARVDSRRQKSV